MKEAPVTRQPERQALKGAHVHGVVRGDWGHTSEQPPLLDEASTRYPKKKKRRDRKPKERCPSNPNGHAHEWMRDTEEVPVHEYVRGKDTVIHLNGETMTFPHWRYVQTGFRIQQYKLCAWCGKEKVKVHSRWRIRGRKTFWD